MTKKIIGADDLPDLLNDFNTQLAEKANQTDLNTTNANVTANASTIATKADKSYVDTKVASVASGSPKGTYATLSALQTAYPTGNTNIYVVTSDGGWYFWNGSAWTKGGTYQSTGIPDNSITQQKLNFPAIQGKPRINLFNKDTITKDSYIDRGSGNVLSATGYTASDYIIVSPSISYICNMTDGSEQLAFYDSNKVYISGLLEPTTSFTTPANAMYVRLTVKLTNVAGFMFVQDTQLPATYQPFIKPTALNFDDSLQDLEIAILNSGFSDNFKRQYGNLYNKNTAITGYYVDRGNGNIVANASYSTTDFIKVSPSTAYGTNMKDAGEQLAFYDSAKNYVSGLLTPTSFTTPSNAAYVKLTVALGNINTFMFIQGSTLPTNYVPYYSLVLQNVLINSIAGSVGKTVIIVDKNGKGDYTTVQSAIDNAQDNSTNPVTILIYPGTYEEAPYIGPTRYISLVGLNKTTTIILDKSGSHPAGGIRFEGTGYMKNITSIQTCENAPNILTAQAYALHIDNPDGLGGNSVFEDCVFTSYGSAGVGIGLQQGQTVRFKNCEFNSTCPKASGASIYGAFVVHSSNRTAGVTDQHLIMEHCYGHSLYTNALAVNDLGSGSEQMDVTFVGNNFWCDETGTTVSLTAKTTGNLSGVVNLTPRSYGNNVSVLNAS